jgi:hypothetical protein
MISIRPLTGKQTNVLEARTQSKQPTKTLLSAVQSRVSMAMVMPQSSQTMEPIFNKTEILI